MPFSVEVSGLVLYASQQLGVMLGVGAETIVLVAYLVSLRDGVVEAKEAQFARAVRRALYIGLGIIILSGVGVLAFHYMLGQTAIFYEPAFLFKWFLMAFLLLAALARSRIGAFSHVLWEGAIGGTWFALFIVHILAPVTSWPMLLGLWAAWMLGFEACWWALAFALRGGTATLEHKPAPLAKPLLPEKKKISLPEFKPQFSRPAPRVEVRPTPPPAPKPSPMPPMPPHRPIAAAMPAPKKPPFMPVPHKPVLAVPHKPAMPSVAVPHKPAATAPEETVNLPAIWVMPRTPEDMNSRHRGPVVQFKQV